MISVLLTLGALAAATSTAHYGMATGIFWMVAGNIKPAHMPATVRKHYHILCGKMFGCALAAVITAWLAGYLA